jgi:dTDP-4-amino-4,6-dideoxygalactose transaminase
LSVSVEAGIMLALELQPKDRMSGNAPRANYLYPLIRPVVPAPEEWIPFLGESYRRHWFSNFGPAAAQFEAGLATEFGEPEDKFVVTSSATAGLCACLIAGRITGPVLVPAFTFPATVAAIRMAGAEPWLIDVNAATWSCDLEKLGDALRKTGAAAVMPVAPFGITQDFAGHRALCEAVGALMIVDNAAGLGGGARQRQAVRGNAFEVFSLHATKPFAVGEGGAIRTDEAHVAALRSAINFGLPWRPQVPSGHGINGKMPEIAAAVGLAILERYGDIVRERQRQAALYMDLLGRFDELAFPTDAAAAPWQVFPCLLPSAEATSHFVEETARRGLEVRQYYRPSLTEWGGIPIAGDCSTADDLAARMVCLPVYSHTTEAEIAGIHEIVALVMGHLTRQY